MEFIVLGNCPKTVVKFCVEKLADGFKQIFHASPPLGFLLVVIV